VIGRVLVGALCGLRCGGTAPRFAIALRRHRRALHSPNENSSPFPVGTVVNRDGCSDPVPSGACGEAGGAFAFRHSLIQQMGARYAVAL